MHRVNDYSHHIKTVSSSAWCAEWHADQTPMTQQHTHTHGTAQPSTPPPNVPTLMYLDQCKSQHPSYALLLALFCGPQLLWFSPISTANNNQFRSRKHFLAKFTLKLENFTQEQSCFNLYASQDNSLRFSSTPSPIHSSHTPYCCIFQPAFGCCALQTWFKNVCSYNSYEMQKSKQNEAK